MICVNDGSTDGSEAIALTFAARDPRFRVISQSNGGYGKAINTGMKAAKGTFFTIVESDDVITSDAYKVLLELLGRDKTLDFVKTPYQPFTVDGPKAQMAVPPSGRAAADLLCASPPVAPVTYRADALIFQPPAIWSGIYRRSRLEQFRITLPETPGAGYQDTCFSAMCLLNGLKYHWVTDRYYMYRVDRETASRHMKNRRDEMVLLFDFIRKNLQGNRRWGKDSKPCFYAVYFRRLIWFMQRVSPDYQFKLPKKQPLPLGWVPMRIQGSWRGAEGLRGRVAGVAHRRRLRLDLDRSCHAARHCRTARRSCAPWL